MKIFDARCLPPVPVARETFVYRKAAFEGRTKRGVPIDRMFTDGTAEEFVASLDAHGVAKVVAAGRPLGPGPNRNGAFEEVPNQAMLDFACAYPDKALAVAAIDANLLVDPAREIAAFREQGYAGFLMMPGWCPGHLHVDDPALERAYRAIDDSGLPLYLLAGGFAGPDITWSDPARIDRVAASFPEMTIVMLYGGHPYTQQAMGVIYRRTNVWCMPDSYFPGVTGEADYVSAMRTYGKERFLYSSNYPLFSYEEHMRRVLNLGLPDEVLEGFLWGNAERLFLS